MTGVDMRTLVQETSEVLATSGSDTDQAGRNLALSGLEIFLVLADKLVIPIVVTILGKLLGDAFTLKKPVDSVAALQAVIDTIELPQLNMSVAEKAEIVAATALRLQGFGYAQVQANVLAGSIVAKVEKAFALGAATVNDKGR